MRIESDSSSIQARVSRVVDEYRIERILASIVLCLCSLAGPELTNAEQTFDFNIPQQRADLALTEFAEQADLTLVFPSELVREQTANELVGEFSLEDGIQILLEGTGLSPRFSNPIVLSIAVDEAIPEGGTMTSKRKTGLAAILSAIFVSTGVSGQQIDEIVVTGHRAANQNAINAKRESTRILDAVGTDDIASLPDFNVGEAAQRIPGVTVTNDQAEARFITIRALNPSYNLMTVDGSSFAVPDRNGRRPFMDTLPSSLASRIEVVKSLTPDLDGAAVGGIVNIVSRSAYDFEDQFLKIATTYGEYENDAGFVSNGPSGTADVVWANQFGERDEYGVVLTANYYKRDSFIPQVEYGSDRYWFDAAGDRAPAYEGAIGEGGEVPRERRWYYYHNDRERVGASAKFEYRPTVEQNYWIRSFYNSATDDEMRQTGILFFGGNGTVPNQTINADGKVTGAVNGDTRHAVYLGQFDFERNVWAFQIGHERDLADNKTLTLIGNLSGSKFDNPELWHEWRNNGTDFNYTAIGGGEYSFELVDRAAYDDLGNYAAERQNALDTRRLDEDISELQFDFGSNSKGQVNGWGYQLGAKWRRTDRAFDEDGQRYVDVAGVNSYTLEEADVLIPTKLCPPGPDCGPDDPMFIVDPVRAIRNFEAHLAANPDQWALDDQVNNDNRRDYSIVEDVLAGYGMLTHQGDRHNLIFGLRYEKTEWDGTGRGQINGMRVDTKNNGNYDNVLPSVTFNYDLRDNVVFRAAASQSIGRVPFNALAPVDEDVDTTGLVVEVVRSNPNLKPRRSDNLDFAIDWYIDDGAGIISAGIFFKKLTDEYFQVESNETINLDGQQVDALVTQYQNIGDDINIQGLEINVIKNFSSLPKPFNGLGISANATFLSTDFHIDDGTNTVDFQERELLVGQSEDTSNIALFYDSDRFSARIAYNRTGLKLSERVNFGTPHLSRYDTPKEKVDFQAAFRFSDRWTGTFNIWNLTGDGRGEVLGRNQELAIVEADFGRAVFVGLTYDNE